MVAFFAHRLWVLEQGFVSSGKAETFQLQRGKFVGLKFAPAHRPAAVIFFGSGDGGWGPWEDTVAQALQGAGFEVIGIDSARYATTPYNLRTLQADFGTIARETFSSLGAKPPPLIVGGWSMGAGQAIAVAGGPNPPPHLKGLLLASPLSRGRYGLRLADKLNILPTGPGTFAVHDFDNGMRNLRVVQWHAEKDSIDSRVWLASLPAPHQEHDFPHAGHDYDGADTTFLKSFVGSVDWILHDSGPPRKNSDDTWPTKTARDAP